MPDKPDQNNPTEGHATATQTARSGSARAPAGKPISGSKRQFIIAMRRADPMLIPAMGYWPLGMDSVEQTLRSTADVDLSETIGLHDGNGMLSADGLLGSPSVLIARMPDDKAELLRQQAHGQLIVEVDQPLHLSHFDGEPALVTGIAAAVGPVLTTTIVVLGKDNNPVKEAEVNLFGSFASATGLTDDRGNVTLSLSGETVQSIRALYVKPKSDYWTFYQALPAIDASQPNLVYLRALTDSFPDFPRQQVIGWGQKVMRLDQLPTHYRGQGVKVAIIDSGVASGHVDLQRVKSGIDIMNKKNGAISWNQDSVSHGTHCAGIIAAGENSLGIRGFAPDAEVHVCKVFPGGQISSVIQALEYCIEHQVDVASIDLCANEPSEALEQQLLRAKRLGVALIAAAGNSGGPVEYPASSPNVLAVAAIGKWGEFPPDSYHALTVGYLDRTGLFSTRFSCFGPQIALCAPGVAILSSVPPNNYAVRDGTSLAAAHVSGLAALILAHHPDFQGPFRMRNSDRVDRLFQILKLSAQPVNLGDPLHTGFGIPDVLAALGLVPYPSTLLMRMFPPAYNPYQTAGLYRTMGSVGAAQVYPGAVAGAGW